MCYNLIIKYLKHMNLEKFLNPVTLNEFTAIWLFKSWAKYTVKTKFDNNYFVSNEEDMDKLYMSLIYWVSINSNNKLLDTFENAACFMSESLGIHDSNSLAEIFARENWDTLIQYNYYIPVTFSTRPDTTVSIDDIPDASHEIVDLNEILMPESCNKFDSKIYKNENPEQITITFGEEYDDTVDDSDEWFTGKRPTGTRAPHECDRNKKWKWAESLNRSSNWSYTAINNKLIYEHPDEFVVIYGANAVGPLRVYQVDKAHFGKTLNEMREDGYYNMLRVSYSKAYSVATSDVRILTLKSYMSTHKDRILRLYNVKES